MGLSEIEQLFLFANFDGNARGGLRDAAVTWGAEDLGYLGGLFEFPDESVFSASASDDKDLHEGLFGFGPDGLAEGLESGLALFLDHGREGGLHGRHFREEELVMLLEEGAQFAVGFGVLGGFQRSFDLGKEEGLGFGDPEKDALGKPDSRLLCAVRAIGSWGVWATGFEIEVRKVTEWSKRGVAGALGAVLRDERQEATALGLWGSGGFSGLEDYGREGRAGLEGEALLLIGGGIILGPGLGE